MSDFLFDDDAFDDDDIGASADTPTVAANEPVRLRGYEAIEAQLVAAVNADRMPHALIFAGEAGRGKESLALKLARALLSTRKQWPAADLEVETSDPILSRVEAGSHPDLLVVRRQQKEKSGGLSNIITIDAMRDAISFLTLKSLESDWRLVIVDEAHLMSIDSQNAFLKTLEEPPPHTVLILIAHQPARLLPTIRSRAQLVNFPPLPPTMLLDTADSAFRALPRDTQDVVIRMARGGIGAFKTLQNPDVATAVERIRSLLAPSTPAQDYYAFSESWGTSQIEGIDPMLLLEEVFGDELRQRLVNTLDDQNVKDASLDKIDALQDLFSLARSRNLDKKQTIRQAYGIMHD